MQTVVLHRFPAHLKWLIGIFLIVLSVGYFTGLNFINNTTGNTPQGIQENYLGNEEDENAEVMKFKKPKREMLTVVHTHILSMSVIFFILGGLVYMTSIPLFLKKFLMMEPLISVVLTFGGIYGMWKGWLWLKYIVMFSGILMTFSYCCALLVVFKDLFKRPSKQAIGNEHKQ